jgi:hypothetical protein
MVSTDSLSDRNAPRVASSSKASPCSQISSDAKSSLSRSWPAGKPSSRSYRRANMASLARRASPSAGNSR